MRVASEYAYRYAKNMGPLHLAATSFSPMACRNPEACDKNHLRYFTDLTGQHIELVLAHFKNDTIKGTQYLPMNPILRLPLVYLEQAHKILFPTAPTLWFNTRGVAYEQAYWSTICSKALTLPDGRRITAKDYR